MATPSLSLRHVSDFAADVRASLTKPGQRELPSKYLYDEVGSALFETICVLPEYGLTRADARLLQKHAGEIVRRLPSPIQVAELGSGSGKKTRWILEALSRRQETYYYPIEISPYALAACEKELGADFDLNCFQHEARWNYAERRIEMHLRSLRRQTVRIPAAGVRVMLDEDETIWTESSHKYRADEIPGMAERTGFRCDGQWIDREWPFAQNLLIAE